MTIILLLIFRLYLLNGVHDFMFLLFWWPLFVLFILADILAIVEKSNEIEKRKLLRKLIEERIDEYDGRTDKED